MWRASKFAQDLPQQITIDAVESLCKVDEGDKKVTMLFPTFSWRSLATKIISVVLRARRKPHWDFGTTVSSTYVRRQINITQASNLPATERREMPRLLPQPALSPFLAIAVSPSPPETAKEAGYDASRTASHRDLSWRPFSSTSTSLTRQPPSRDSMHMLTT